MKAIHQKNLSFIQAVINLENEYCKEVFIAHKHDIRLTLFDLLQPRGMQKENLLTAYKSGNGASRLALLEQLFQFYCPNPAFKAILLKLKRGKTPKLDAQTTMRLEQFRRGPTKAEVNLLFDVLRVEDIAVGCRLLEKARSFGREFAHQLPYILEMGQSSHPELVKSCLMLLPHIPEGIEKGLFLYQKQITVAGMRFHALNALQAAKGISPDVLYQMFEPILRTYEHLSKTQGSMNDLWAEVNMIKSILAKNGASNRVWMLSSNVGFKS